MVIGSSVPRLRVRQTIMEGSTWLNQTADLVEAGNGSQAYMETGEERQGVQDLLPPSPIIKSLHSVSITHEFINLQMNYLCMKSDPERLSHLP